MPTQAAASLPSSDGQGRENTTKGSWTEIQTGRDHSTDAITLKGDSTWENQFNLLTNKSE